MIWIREPRYDEKPTTKVDPDMLVKKIVNAVYPDAIAHKMLQKISGIVGSINSSNKHATREELYNFIKIRLSTDPVYQPFMKHELAEAFISNKITRLISNRH